MCDIVEILLTPSAYVAKCIAKHIRSVFFRFFMAKIYMRSAYWVDRVHSDKFVIREIFGELKNSTFGYNIDIIRE
jgi:hypothetical protein